MADAAVHGHGEHGQPGFFTRWFMSTNHRDIEILYLFTAGVVGLISVLFTVYMRMELMEPGVQYMCLEGARFIADPAAECTPNGHLWNVLITYHGVLMMFFVIACAMRSRRLRNHSFQFRKLLLVQWGENPDPQRHDGCCRPGPVAPRWWCRRPSPGIPCQTGCTRGEVLIGMVVAND